MQTENRLHRVDFIEFPAPSAEELMRTTQFYGTVFGWSYKDWGRQYSDTQSSGVATGINADPAHRPQQPLVVVYSDNLESARANVVKAEGKITKEIFSFPGGRRFHFIDPIGNELAVWSDL